MFWFFLSFSSPEEFIEICIELKKVHYFWSNTIYFWYLFRANRKRRFCHQPVICIEKFIISSLEEKYIHGFFSSLLNKSHVSIFFSFWFMTMKFTFFFFFPFYSTLTQEKCSFNSVSRLHIPFLAGSLKLISVNYLEI